MSDLTLKAAATKLAEETPQHLGKPTTPPIAWRQEGDELIVLLADGRKVRAPIADLKPTPAPTLRAAPPSYSTPGIRVQEPIPAPKVHTRPVPALKPVRPSPAKHKAG